MSARDLFGQEVDPASIAEAPYGTRPRAAQRPRGGYAAPPGSGPDGETCGTCERSYRRATRANKAFWKCSLIRETNGAGSDIRKSAPACSRWEILTTPKVDK